MQAKRIISLSVLFLSSVWSTQTGGLRFIPIYDSLTIRAQRNSPVYMAFLDLTNSVSKKNEDVFANENIQKINSVRLETNAHLSASFAKKFENKIILSEFTISKEPAVLNVGVSTKNLYSAKANYTGLNEQYSDRDQWVDELPLKSQARLREAQSRSDVLNEDWSGQGFSEMAKEVLERNGVLKSISQGTQDHLGNKVFISATDLSGKTRTEISKVQFDPGNGSSLGVNSLVSNSSDGGISSARMISGPLEITGGLAVTNEHHIEVRRTEEGVSRELGSVDLTKGTYSISVDDTAGSILARLIDKEGKTIGEGSFRLSRLLAQDAKVLQGPKIRIEPHPDFSGVIANFYNSNPSGGSPPKTRATLIKGVNDIEVAKDGAVNMDNASKGSTTVLRAAAPKFMQTTQIIVSGQEFKTYLYPITMMTSLQEIVSQQRMQMIDRVPTIVWGQISLDGKPLSGIQVSIESDQGQEPIYFNQFMLPDPKLSSTSENGLYAFINVKKGFHSLIATRSESYFGYTNVIVEEGSVAQGDITSTLKSEPVIVKIFDGLKGERATAKIEMQSLENELIVNEGIENIFLPRVNRLGMAKVEPVDAEYSLARYLYNDVDEFIHIPLVKTMWITGIKSEMKIDDTPNTGSVVGFVPDEDFEVYLAGQDDFLQRNIVYFDVHGRPLLNRTGVSGGGFIIFNVPDDTQEIVVIGSKTQKIYSRVLPVDPNSLSVLSFR